MPPYPPHGLTLTRDQVKKLASGQAIRLKHPHLHGNHPVHLTRQQLTKIAKHHTKGVGMELRMSPAQVTYNIRRGGGFWDTLKSIGRTVAGVVEKGASFINHPAAAPIGAIAGGVKRLLGGRLVYVA